MPEQKDNARKEKRNGFLFYTALFVTIGLLVWFTLAFFRDHWKMHDVSVGILLVGVGIIASYASHNKMLKKSCPLEAKERRGEWIFALTLAWAGIMWTLYQARVFARLWGVELAVPEHFYTFLGTLAAIFGFSSIWDFLPPLRRNGNNNGEIINADNKETK